jgi:alpha-N-acetylglucosaminidase
MILLDYFCENTEVWQRTESFFNQPFIWCYLGNFGGNTMLAGNLAEVENRLENTFLKTGKNMWGIGSTLEGFDVNPFMYEYVFEKAWSEGHVDLIQWMKNWADRRCGTADKDVEKAWQILYEKIYTHPAKCTESTLTNARPSIEGYGNWTTNNQIGYNNMDLLDAWEVLLKSTDTKRQAYQYDVVNVGRQVLGNYFTQLRDQFVSYYKNKDLAMMNQTAHTMTELMDDMDNLLATQSSFLLGKWLNDAKRMGISPAEKKYYEQNARMLITTWGAKATTLNDYGNRTWAGLLKGYYSVRWKMFTDDLIRAVEENTAFDEKVFDEKVTSFEWNWTMQNELYNDKSVGDAIQIAKLVYAKYTGLIRSANSK